MGKSAASNAFIKLMRKDLMRVKSLVDSAAALAVKETGVIEQQAHT